MIKNIGIDGFQLNHYGIGTYLRNTLRHLKGIEDQRYFVFCHSNDVSQIEQLNPELIPVKYDNFNYTTADLLKISRHFKKLGLHLFHAVHYITPLFHKLPIIATVHDMLPFEYPGSYTEIERRGTLKNIEKTLQKAAAVVSVSKSTKSDILKHFKLNPDKIEVIYNGVDDKFFDKIDYRRVKRMKERYQLDYPFILYAGNVRPHKNLSGLINCFDELIEPPFNKYRLVIAGYELARNKTLRRLISKKNLQNRVRFLGYITQVEYLYKLAEIFINPSLYEGFGVSILEAMAIGTPVIASNKSALPEIAGEAAILVDPYNSIEIADSIKKIISDKGARAKLIKMGKDRACEFKWEESVRRLVEVYSEILK